MFAEWYDLSNPNNGVLSLTIELALKEISFFLSDMTNKGPFWFFLDTKELSNYDFPLQLEAQHLNCKFELRQQIGTTIKVSE